MAVDEETLTAPYRVLPIKLPCLGAVSVSDPGGDPHHCYLLGLGGVARGAKLLALDGHHVRHP